MSSDVTQDLRERLKAASQRKSEEYTLPGTDIAVEVRSMTVGQRSRFKDIAKLDGAGQPQGKLDEIQFFVLRQCVFGLDDGKPLFRDGDLGMVQEMSPEVVDPLVKKAMELSGLSKEAAAAAKNG